MFLADVKGWNRLSGSNNGKLREIFNAQPAWERFRATGVPPVFGRRTPV